MAEESWEAKENAVVQCPTAPGAGCGGFMIDDADDTFSTYGAWHTLTTTDGLFNQRMIDRSVSSIRITGDEMEVRNFVA